ncbi:MAG TPA: inositol monophosphatase family protein [Alphaproteobacteria bacterium]|nr:inositol monophosphatase family protein [Alphaproteobacteria bacterium]
MSGGPPIRIDPDDIAALIRRAAEECILPRFRRLARHEVREKSPGNLVTAADVEAERLLSRLLSETLPGAAVIGEEAAAHDPAILARLGEHDAAWIVDPVDGTHQFAHGNPEFAVIVALVARGAVCAGWIHDPVRNTTVAAEAGAGTWRLGDAAGPTRLELAPAPPLGTARGVLLGKLASGARASEVARARLAAGPVSFVRSAGQIYLHLVEGGLEYAFFTRALPWDHAAGWLIHAEAGGYGRFLDGASYSPSRHVGPILYAPDRGMWRAIAEVLERG